MPKKFTGANTVTSIELKYPKDQCLEKLFFSDNSIVFFKLLFCTNALKVKSILNLHQNGVSDLHWSGGQ